MLSLSFFALHLFESLTSDLVSNMGLFIISFDLLCMFVYGVVRSLFPIRKSLSWIGHSRRHRHTGIDTHSSAHLNLIVCLSLLNLTRTLSSILSFSAPQCVCLFIRLGFSLYICQITKFSQLTLLTESFHSF